MTNPLEGINTAGGPGAEAERTQHFQMINASASAGHELWKKTFKEAARAKGEPETRVKQLKDPAEVEKFGESVDIANLAFSELPPSWQTENERGATVAVDLVLTAVAEGHALDEAFVEEASAKVHVAWLERNGDYATDVQKLPYSELPEDEKERDRVFVRAAIEALGS